MTPPGPGDAGDADADADHAQRRADRRPQGGHEPRPVAPGNRPARGGPRPPRSDQRAGRRDHRERARDDARPPAPDHDPAPLAGAAVRPEQPRPAPERPRPPRIIGPRISNDLQQHDLEPAAARGIVTGAHLRQGDVVLEIGAGRGALTAELLQAGALVHAIERDQDRCAVLAKRFSREIASRMLVLHAGDALRVGPRLTGRWRAIANPPFNLTADLVRRWLLDPLGDQPEALDLVLQYETARKLCGHDGHHTRSSVITRLAGKPWISQKLSREQVSPPSRVDLCVWSLRQVPSIPKPDELQRIDRLVAIAFAGTHTVAEALRGVATGVQIRRQASEHGWKPDDHPRTLKPVAWRSLATLLAMCGKI